MGGRCAESAHGRPASVVSWVASLNTQPNSVQNGGIGRGMSQTEVAGAIPVAGNRAIPELLIVPPGFGLPVGLPKRKSANVLHSAAKLAQSCRGRAFPWAQACGGESMEGRVIVKATRASSARPPPGVGCFRRLSVLSEPQSNKVIKPTFDSGTLSLPLQGTAVKRGLSQRYT